MAGRSVPDTPMPTARTPILFSLFALYVIWGSTYLAIRVGVDSWPPLMMAGVRYLLAGLLLFAWVRWRQRAPLPTLRETAGAALLGLLMPAIGNGLVTMAETRVTSGVAALVVATVPLFTTLFSRFLGHRTRPAEWLALALGFCGIAILNFGSSLAASPVGALLLVIACAGWALGSALSKVVPQPSGLMSSATMMLAAGIELLAASLLSGERLAAVPSLSGWLALGYLVLFGSIIAYSAYVYLLSHVSPALATSYAYVNPVIAVLLGMGLLGEHVASLEWLGMVVIIGAVLLLARRAA